MIEGTQLRNTALQFFSDDTKKFVSGVLDLVAALEDDDEVMASLLLIFIHFVSDSAVTVLAKASLPGTALDGG